jgi:DNA-binding IclR family transcriptional regulator
VAHNPDVGFSGSIAMTAVGRAPEMELCKQRGFAVSLGEWRREIFGVAAPLYRTPTGDCLAVNCGIPSFRFNAEQIERECGPRILGLARSIRSLAGGQDAT